LLGVLPRKDDATGLCLHVVGVAETVKRKTALIFRIEIFWFESQYRHIFFYFRYFYTHTQLKPCNNTSVLIILTKINFAT
jgi:hypothetical protein